MKCLNPRKRPVTPSAKAAVENAPVQVEVAVPQPVKATVDSSAKVVVENASVPVEVVASEVPHPVKATVTPSAKSVVENVPVQAGFVASEISHPVKATGSQTTNLVVEDAPVSDVSQFVKATVVPGEKSVIENVSVSVSEVAQPVKVVGNDVLQDNNTPAESRLGGGVRPQIKNEAFVVGQGNVPAKSQSVMDSSSVRVEIDHEKKDVSDVDAANFVGAMDRGGAGVKVSEKMPVAQVDPMVTDVIEQITSHVKARVKGGETSIRMELNPGELGQIEVQVKHNAQGISVSFITEQSSTGQLLESQSNQLRQSLKDAGVQLMNLNISQHHQPNREGGGFKQSQPFVQDARRNIPQVEVVEGMQPQRVGSDGEIDYLV